MVARGFLLDLSLISEKRAVTEQPAHWGLFSQVIFELLQWA